MLAENRIIDQITDTEWCDAIITSVTNPDHTIGGLQLPAFPEERLQNLTIQNGASKSMLKAACKLYGHVKAACNDLDQPLQSNTNILDFGCGWGRIARFFLKEVDVKNLYGVEVLQELAEACESTFKSKNFRTISQAGGALPFDSEKFDVVFANSVFSHLNVDLNLQWFNEIERVLKPGGIAALTVIDVPKFEQMLKSGTEWFNSLGIDVDETRDQLKSGKFVWVSTNRTGELDGYGLTFIPVEWIEKNWTGRMKLVNVNEDYHQSIAILQKNK